MATKNLVPFTNPNMPYIYNDPVISKGTLVLVDMAHPAQPAAAGIPANGALLPNIAWKTAQRIIGTGTQSSLSAVFDIGPAFTSSVGVLERSGKGGLHAMMSPTTASGTGKGVAIHTPQEVVDYMLANPTHKYYYSLWFRPTRFANNTSRLAYIYMNSAGDASTQLLFAIGSASAASLPTSNKRLGYRRGRNSLRPSDDPTLAFPYSEPLMMNIAVDGNTGTVNVAGAAAQALSTLWQAGSYPSTVGASGNGFMSSIFWRATLEDLTAAGRSYGEMDMIDAALYAKQCQAAGGKFYADTYTTPAVP